MKVDGVDRIDESRWDRWVGDGLELLEASAFGNKYIMK